MTGAIWHAACLIEGQPSRNRDAGVSREKTNNYQRRTTMNASKVIATLSQADQETVLTAIAAIRQKLPFLIDLTTAERQSIVKLGNKSHLFVKKAVDVATQNPGVLPTAIGVEDLRNGVQLFESLTTIKIAIDQLQKQIDDTTMQAGSDAYA